MYAKEQGEIELKEYEWLESVHGVIRRLGISRASSLFTVGIMS